MYTYTDAGTCTHIYTFVCVCVCISKRSIRVEVMWEKLEKGRGKGGNDVNTVPTYKIPTINKNKTN